MVKVYFIAIFYYIFLLQCYITSAWNPFNGWFFKNELSPVANFQPAIVKEVRIKFEDESDITPRSLLLLQIVLLFQKCDCNRAEQSCKCCFSLDLITKSPCCLALTYSPHKRYVRGTISFGEKVLLTFFISVTSSEEDACFSVPMPVALGICIQFYGFIFDRSEQTITLCSRFELTMLKRQMYSTDFGCFTFGAQNALARLTNDGGGETDLVTVSLSKDEIRKVTKCFLAAERGVHAIECQ